MDPIAICLSQDHQVIGLLTDQDLFLRLETKQGGLELADSVELQCIRPLLTWKVTVKL
jgi:hypothetical protein